MPTNVYPLADGTVVEVTSSDTYTGPGKKTGLRVGSGQWYRVNGGPWALSKHRNRHRQTEWLLMCQNLVDFLEGEQVDL